MNAIGYVRRSKKSDEKTVSIEAQRDHIARYCAGAGVTLSAIVEHDGVSGTKRKRFDAVDKAIADYNPSRVVIYQLDRLARDVAGLLDYLRMLAGRGIKVFEATGNEVTLTEPTAFLNVGVQGLFAEFYPRLVGQKTRDALSKLQAEGKRYTNIPPLGYAYVAGAMVCDPEEQRGLTILRECKLAGLGARRSLAVLQARNYTGRQSLKAIHNALRGVQC